MKATLVLDVDIRGEKLWLAECVHETSDLSGSFYVTELFADEEDARSWMVREVSRVGMNLLTMYRGKAESRSAARKIRYHFDINEEQYECSANIVIRGKVVDTYYGSLKYKTIN